MWSLVSALAAPAPILGPECKAAVATEIQAQEATKTALEETVKQAIATPGITQLTSELQGITNIWASHERSTATVDQITTSRSDANVQIEALLTQLDAQWSVDEAVRTAERDHMLAVIAQREAMCAAAACSAEPICMDKPHAGTTKVMADVTDLYKTLSTAEDNFQNVYSYEVLLGRVRAGGLTEQYVGTDQARAAWLLSHLAVSTVRPSRARARVAAFLSEAGGRARISANELRYGRHLIIWSADRERRLKHLDEAIDHLIDSWLRLDVSRTQDGPRPNITLAVQKLRQHNPAPPPSMANFR